MQALLEDNCSSEDSGFKTLYGFGLSTTAGLMTLLGAATIYFPIPQHHMRLASCFCLATASGVMAYVSLVEVFGEAKANFEESYPYSENNEKKALVLATISFFVGWFLGIGMDFVLHKFVPTSSEESLKTDPEAHSFLDARNEESVAQFKFEQDTFRLIRVGWFTALALTIHNIPEGMLTYVSALSSNPSVGLGIACAIGLHNIPEGFAVAFPIMIGTKSKRKAMFYAGITGFAEPFGALLGWIMFDRNNASSEDHKYMFGWLFGITAGIMTEVAVKSLLLESARYDPTDRIVSKAWIFGAFVIGISLIVIEYTAPKEVICNGIDSQISSSNHCSSEELKTLCPLLETGA